MSLVIGPAVSTTTRSMRIPILIGALCCVAAVMLIWRFMVGGRPPPPPPVPPPPPPSPASPYLSFLVAESARRPTPAADRRVSASAVPEMQQRRVECSQLSPAGRAARQEDGAGLLGNGASEATDKAAGKLVDVWKANADEVPPWVAPAGGVV